jgi:urease accessory protein
LTSLETEFAAILEAYPGDVLGGVSQPAVPGLVVKLLARSAPDLAAIQEALWGAVRRTLWNLNPVALRKY